MATMRYRVYMTPFDTVGVYGSEVEVSDRVTMSGLNKMVKSIDASDFDIGVYWYGDITLTGANDDGYFNEDDDRSIFNVGRDLTKVRVVADIDGTETTLFRGLINEESTRLNIKTHSIQFRVLSLDSVIRTSKVAAGLISSGMTVSAAILAILDQAHITSVLNVSASNINVNLDTTIDDGSVYSNENTRKVLSELLVISNSAMFLDSSDNVLIKSRSDDTSQAVVNLYGAHDILGRENIIDIKKYNTGKHRMFNAVKLGTVERQDDALVAAFGYKQKKIDIDSITDTEKQATIASRLVSEFGAPKLEVIVTVSTVFAVNMDLLDRVSINYPLRLERTGTYLPVIGVTEIGDSEATLPNKYGSVSINPNTAFKVIQITHSAKGFTTELKLRQRGTTLSDGVFNEPGNCIIGFAVIGEAVICEGSTDPFNPSVIGAAVIGGTKTA